MIATRIYRCSKNGARDLQIFEEYVFYQVRKMVTGLQRKWWFSKTLKKAYTSDKIEAYRFSLWFYKNSIRWSLPKKCITSLLILTFLKFNEKRSIIHAHRNLISQFVPYEKSKNGARDLQIFEEYVFYQVRKLVTGLQRKWWFSNSLKKAYTSDNFWSLSFQSLVL